MASRKPSTLVALEFAPSHVRFVEMQPDGQHVVSAGVVALEGPTDGGSDVGTLAEAVRAALSQTRGFHRGTLIGSLPVRHAFLRRIDLPAETRDIPAALRWDMEKYLARPLDWYALDFQPLAGADADGGLRYLAAAYRLSEIEAVREAVAEAGAPPLAALDLDAAALINVLAINYPECLTERTLIIKADARATSFFRTQGGEYLGGSVQRDGGEVSFGAIDPQERAERLLHRARLITLGLPDALGAWEEPERIFLCGDLAGDADFRELLKTRGLIAPFALLNPFRKISGPHPDAYPAAYPGAPFAAAVGLALRAAHAPTPPGHPPLRIDLLRHLAPREAAETAPAPAAPRRHKAEGPKRAPVKRLVLAAALLALAVAVGLALRNPEWVRERLARATTAPAAPARDTVAAPDSLELKASALVASQQLAAISWLAEMEYALPPDSLGELRVRLAAFTAPDAFLLRGVSQGHGFLGTLQESLVLVPGLALLRSDTRAIKENRYDLEFLFSGTFVTERADSLPMHRVLPRAEIDAEWNRFLEGAASAGLVLQTLPAAAPTASGNLEARPYRLSGPCDPVLLRGFLENEHRRGSPFGVQRVRLENPSDSAVVFLDIMAFSR
jgi:hypothetical protein